MALLYADRVRVATATTGTGTINLGVASSGFRTFASAVTDGALVSGCTLYYGIQDGNNWECGLGTYTAGSPDTLTRTVTSSSSGGTTAITLSGSAQVAIVINQSALITQALSDASNNLATTSFVNSVSQGLTSVSVAGSANVTLTALQAAYGIIVLTGAITASINVIVPTASNRFIIENITSGAFTITVKTAAGTGIVVAQGYNLSLFCDGTNVLRTSNDSTSVAITGGTINNTTIGVTTAATGVFTGLAGKPYALTYAATITPNCSLAAIFTVTLTGNVTLANPTSITAGGQYRFVITQDATGTRTITFGTVYKFANRSTAVLSTTANYVDVLDCFSPDGTNLYCVLSANFG